MKFQNVFIRKVYRWRPKTIREIFDLENGFEIKRVLPNIANEILHLVFHNKSKLLLVKDIHYFALD